MGFVERIRALFGRESALVAAPSNPRDVPARTLNVHTVNLSPDSNEFIVVLTVDEHAFAQLLLIDAPLRLTSPTSRPVTFATGVPGGAPTLDPNVGWLIPVTEETAEEIRALPSGPGEHELATIHVALVVEPLAAE